MHTSSILAGDSLGGGPGRLPRTGTRPSIRFRLAGLLGLLACAPDLSAEGSFTSEAVLPALLAQDPELATFVERTLDIGATGSAARVGAALSPHLGGSRIGPYVVPARPKGSTGAYSLQLTVNTEIHFLDERGAEAGPQQAVRLREDLVGIELRGAASRNGVPPLSKDPGKSPAP